MAAKKRKPKKPHSISHGRPPVLHNPAAALSSKAARTIIRSHHVLEKALARATAAGDTAKARDLQAQIERQGGLKSYQRASLTGQSSVRGGDSSKVLMEWLGPSFKSLNAHAKSDIGLLRLLEVGALSSSNTCSHCPFIAVTRIDLNSQDEGILRQDFMQRPLPACDEEAFDIVSLSLVLNYVPDAVGRGEMLRRTTQFYQSSSAAPLSQAPFPSLFLVLPAPCVTNSRYMDDKRLSEIMQSLGYVLVKSKISAKLAYYLWKYTSQTTGKAAKFKKTEVNPGGLRNNFAVILL